MSSVLAQAWVGVDPGAVATGVVLRAGLRAYAHQIIHRTSDETPIGPGPCYISEIARAVDDMRFQWAAAYPQCPAMIAIEDVKPPNPHVKRTNRNGETTWSRVAPKDVMGLAYVLGALHERYPDAVMVEPDGNGSRPLCTYPHELVTDGERRAKHALGMLRPAGDGPMVRHCRSAFDIAGRASVALRIRQARKG